MNGQPVDHPYWRQILLMGEQLMTQPTVTAQREIEKAVRQAVAEHWLKGSERLPAKLTLSIPTVGLTHSIEGDIDLG